MFRVAYKVRIPYSEISDLQDAFDEGKVKAKVRRPSRAPRTRTQLVEIRVTAKAQGREHVRLIEERIVFNNGAIAGKLEEGEETFWSKVGTWISHIWFPSILAYAGIITPVLTFYQVQVLVEDPVELILFLLVAIPTALGIGTSHIVTKK